MTLLKQLLLLLSLLFCAYIEEAMAKDSGTVDLQIKPSQCVSLRQGQTCYVEVEVVWQSNELGDYCLYVQSQKSPVQCWTGRIAGNATYEAATTDDLLFVLTPANSRTVLAQAELKAAWVYQKKRNAVSWRLF